MLLVHGYGADEHDLAPLAPILDPSGACFAVCPRAPIDVEPYGGAAWYDRDGEGEIEASSFQRSVLLLDQLLDAVCAQRGAARARSIVIGFSQGGAMALALALKQTSAERPAGVACLSGVLATPDWLRYAWDAEGWAGRGEPSGFPAVYVQHGTYDPMVDVERGRRTRAVLQANGIEPEYHEYPMQHEIRPESMLDLRAWVDRVLTAT